MAKNPFADALAAHDMRALRAAFEACKQGDETGYDRTTLNRWLDGSIPNREPFVRCLSERLGDPEIYASWQQAKEARSPSRVKTVVSRFEGLSTEEKDEAFHEIRAQYLATFPSVRRRGTYRVEVDDPPDPGDDHLVVRLEMTWRGAIPAGAEAQIVTGHDELGDAYEAATCIFREILDFDTERLTQLLAVGPDPVLAINPVDTNAPRGAHHVGQQVEPGRFRFDNPEATEAQVRLSLSYPYPRGLGVFFIRLGRYQVPDTFEVTLRLNSRSASSPQAFPFLPPGRQREFSQSFLGPDELFFTFGTGNTVYGEGDGLVLYWTES